MRISRFFQPVVLLIPIMVTGCATITSNEMQPVSVTTEDEKGQSFERAKCSIRNDKGSWEAETPAFVQVRRSSEDLLVECKKDGYPVGTLRAISRAAGGMFGNIIFGGGIGAIIDHSKGTGYNYPNTLPVKMGASVVVDRKDKSATADQKPAQ
jgi:hypothetical protein